MNDSVLKCDKISPCSDHWQLWLYLDTCCKLNLKSIIPLCLSSLFLCSCPLFFSLLIYGPELITWTLTCNNLRTFLSLDYFCFTYYSYYSFSVIIMFFHIFSACWIAINLYLFFRSPSCAFSLFRLVATPLRYCLIHVGFGWSSDHAKSHPIDCLCSKPFGCGRKGLSMMLVKCSLSLFGNKYSYMLFGTVDKS